MPKVFEFLNYHSEIEMYINAVALPLIDSKAFKVQSIVTCCAVSLL